MTQTVVAPTTSAYWLIDGLITGFTHEATAASVRYYFPRSCNIAPLTYEEAHEDGDERYSYHDRAEWQSASSCAN